MGRAFSGIVGCLDLSGKARHGFGWGMWAGTSGSEAAFSTSLSFYYFTLLII